MASDDTRRRILDEAIEVIAAVGEDKLRVADVARRAGVTQGMVTYHFITRHNLVVEAQLERYAATMRSDAEFLLSVADHAHDHTAGPVAVDHQQPFAPEGSAVRALD
ncbi:MAG: TetR family transcriptional regulator [Ilumatobacteraceae bacterium]